MSAASAIATSTPAPIILLADRLLCALGSLAASNPVDLAWLSGKREGVRLTE
ncbi:MAG TPA: hypothetical protein VNO32_11025 [Candidatus Acidoferrum sp.]|nr:hypothetical protein [Candidatus Acidoferrum sp.]